MSYKSWGIIQAKKEDLDSHKSHLLQNLKTQIRDLHRTIEGKDLEINDLKRNSRASRVQELKTEMKMYVDECIRLRRMLQEALLQMSQGFIPQEMQQKYIKQSLQLKSLKRDYKELLRLSETSVLHKSKTKKELNLVKLKKNLFNTKEENLKINQDNQRLMQELNSLRINLRCSNCGFIFDDASNKDVNTIIWDIWQSMEHRRLNIQTTWSFLNPEGYPDISLDQVKLGLEKLGLFLTDFEARYFFPNNSEALKFEFFEEVLQKLRPGDLITYDSMIETLYHFSFRLQVRRYEYSQIGTVMFPEARAYYQMEVYSALLQEPIRFTEVQSEMMTKFMFGSSDALGNDECCARLYALIEPWNVLSEQEETQFDADLKRIVQGLNTKLFDELQRIEKNEEGVVELEGFYQVFKGLGVDFSENMKQYLTLLFYSDQFEFNVVPYRNFYQAYSQSTE